MDAEIPRRAGAGLAIGSADRDSIRICVICGLEFKTFPGAGPVDLIGTVFARPPGVPVRQPDVQSPAQLQSQPRSGPTLSQPGLFKPDSPLWNSYI